MPQPQLSNQAKWYLTGLQKTRSCLAATAEPKAMQELISSDLAYLGDDGTYVITQKGMEYEIK